MSILNLPTSSAMNACCSLNTGKTAEVSILGKAWNPMTCWTLQLRILRSALRREFRRRISKRPKRRNSERSDAAANIALSNAARIFRFNNKAILAYDNFTKKENTAQDNVY